MNKTFKTLWNNARGGFVVADEARKSKGKPTKCAAAVIAAAFVAGAAAAADYAEPGFAATSSANLAQARKSWETAEYQKDWGLGAMKASSAYALGWHGQGVAVGVMDSGALLQKHPELAGERFHASQADAHYGSSGQRYPQSGIGNYQAGQSATESGTIDGNWIANVNDSHGTHVTGSVGANRDGKEFHGVAWGADVWVGNTGGTDNTNYGPFQDYKFFYNGWKALADNLVAANGAERGAVINNSFGTNIRIEKNYTTGLDNGDTSVHFPTNTISQTEYEYFLFKQVYGDGPSFVDGAYDAVKGTNVLQVFTTGNRDFVHPFYRPLYPHFNPEAEQNWLAVAGLQKDGDGYKPVNTWNEAGLAKYWTVVAPGKDIYGSKVKPGTDEPSWAESSGTSMAAPHVTGALAVLMSRHQDMNALQVRDVLLTTASHTNPDGSNYAEWTAAEGEVDARYGWGTPDLEKGMYGPGQLLGKFDYNQKTLALDVWSNDISQTALDQRRREDSAWQEAAQAWLALEDAKKLTLEGMREEHKKLLGEILLDTRDDVIGLTPEQEKISEENALAWRTQYYEKRLAAIGAKLENGLYDGSLVKRGAGTLVLTGSNTYRGGTVVEEGVLLGFAESFGVTGEDGAAAANGKVTVNGGTFGVIERYDDRVTFRGALTTSADAGHSVDIAVNKDGVYGIVAGHDVKVGTLNFADGAKLTVLSLEGDVLAQAYSSDKGLTGSVRADKLEGVRPGVNPVVDPDYAFFDTDVKVDLEHGLLQATISRNDKTAAAYAASSGQAALGRALTAGRESAVFGDLAAATKQQVRGTLDSLASDLHLTAQNVTLLNAASMVRTIKDQANAFGQARRAELENGTILWAAGMGAWGKADAGGASVKVDADWRAGLLGVEVPYGKGNKAGVFFGYGWTDFDAGAKGSLDSDDIHLGAYGQNDWDLFGLTYGAAYTSQEIKGKRSLSFLGTSTANNVRYDADVVQVFGEASWKGFNSQSFQMEPYAGLAWFKATADGFAERAGAYSVRTEIKNRNLGLANVGVRAALPFAAGSMALKVRGDVGYSQFFGDKKAAAGITVGDAGSAEIKGESLSGLGTVGLGVDAAVGKNTTFGVSYTGAFGSDVTSHGIGAKLGVKF